MRALVSLGYLTQDRANRILDETGSRWFIERNALTLRGNENEMACSGGTDAPRAAPGAASDRNFTTGLVVYW